MTGPLCHHSILATIGVVMMLAVGWPDPTEAQMEQARDLMRQDRLGEAARVLEDAARTSDGTPKAEALNAKGWVLYRDGKSIDAERAYREALAITRQAHNEALEVKILNNLGINYFAAGDLAKAQAVFSEARERGSTLASRYLELVARQQRTSKVNALVRQGVEHRLHRDFGRAVDAYSKALEIDANNNDALAYRGYAYFRLGEYDLALADLERARQDTPERLDVVINLLKVNCTSGLGPDAGTLLASHQTLVEENRKAFSGDTELRRVCGDRIRSD